jgi:gamma-glutamyl:cysteine ligase YbdK (ATP-grasp superfamily)
MESGARRSTELPDHPELLEENRFLAARDGTRAELLDPHAGRRPVREIADALVDACLPHADALGCRAELERIPELLAWPGESRQRAIAGLRPEEAMGGRRLRRLVERLSWEFVQAAGPSAGLARGGWSVVL